jgi:hypothetical protein
LLKLTEPARAVRSLRATGDAEPARAVGRRIATRRIDASRQVVARRAVCGSAFGGTVVQVLRAQSA